MAARRVTYAILEGLKGEAASRRTGKVNMKALDSYVTERVQELTGGTQKPISYTPNGYDDFPLADLR
jgi:uncharacterized caspase-like protein